MSITLTIALIATVNLILGFFFKSRNAFFCGIIGFSGPKNSNLDLDKLKVLFYINSLERGLHATGLFTPKNGIRKVSDSYVKEIGKEGNIFTNLNKDNVIIGHVRHATVGAHTVNNAHPWEFDRIVGLHNGSLKDYSFSDYSITKKYGLSSTEYPVDSQILLKSLDIDFENLNTKLLPALESYDGAAALLMYHKERETVFACHDKERPLFYGYIGKGMYISSIAPTLDAIGCKGITEFPINKVHEIKNGQIINEFDYVPQSKIVKPKIVTSTTNNLKLHSQDDPLQITTYLFNRDFTTVSNGLGTSQFGDNLIQVNTQTLKKDLGFTGLVSSYDFPVEAVKGYNLRFRSRGKVEFLDLITNKSYVVYGNRDYLNIVGTGDEFHNHYLDFTINGGKQIFRARPFIVNTGNFIPLIGQYVKAIANITTNAGNTHFAFQDDILKVERFYGTTGRYECTTVDGEENLATMPPSFFVKATSEEVKEYALTVRNIELYEEITGKKLDIPNADGSVTTTNSESCEIPVTPGENGIEETVAPILLSDPTEIFEGEEEEEEKTIIEVDADELDDYLEAVDSAFEELAELVNTPVVDVETLVHKVNEFNQHNKQIDFKKLFS